ncbi:MAG: glycoside hydrolase 100 family protein [Cyanobacteria bacterium P01_C01_bin.72]
MISKATETIEQQANRLLSESVIYYQQKPIGAVAATDSERDALNYDQCFIRDFIPAALVFLIQGKTDIVYNFLMETVILQKQERRVDCYQAPTGLMPASFKVESPASGQYLHADFGDKAIGRVTPIDSCLWWIILLRAYVKTTGDLALAQSDSFQEALIFILEICLGPQFEMTPTLLVPDGACMIDRPMGLSGHPLEIQSLFYLALRAAREMLLHNSEGEALINQINNRLGSLLYHLRSYYWLDLKKLNEIHRYQSEQFGESVVNKFNIYPESIPHWLTEWMPDTGGYLAGNLGPGKMDFRFFSLGNLVAIMGSLTTQQQSQDILTLIEQRWSDLVSQMPLKLCYPAISGIHWRIITGCDPKNTPWSYHNGGSWPVLLWLMMAACQKMGREDLAERAMAIAELKLMQDDWPEYYDGKHGRLIGKSSRKFQTWTIAGWLLAKLLRENPHCLDFVCFEEDTEAIACMI